MFLSSLVVSISWGGPDSMRRKISPANHGALYIVYKISIPIASFLGVPGPKIDKNSPDFENIFARDRFDCGDKSTLSNHSILVDP
jgi:hypothetical protein